jgi:hypothetical protein
MPPALRQLRQLKHTAARSRRDVVNSAYQALVVEFLARRLDAKRRALAAARSQLARGCRQTLIMDGARPRPASIVLGDSKLPNSSGTAGSPECSTCLQFRDADRPGADSSARKVTRSPTR